jgi:hypothetical protein
MFQLMSYFLELDWHGYSSDNIVLSSIGVVDAFGNFSFGKIVVNSILLLFWVILFVNIV